MRLGAFCVTRRNDLPYRPIRIHWGMTNAVSTQGGYDIVGHLPLWYLRATFNQNFHPTPLEIARRH